MNNKRTAVRVLTVFYTLVFNASQVAVRSFWISWPGEISYKSFSKSLAPLRRATMKTSARGGPQEITTVVGRFGDGGN
ncbi:hypothetical protein AGIG_G10150 [Arapaima gigas]